MQRNYAEQLKVTKEASEKHISSVLKTAQDQMHKTSEDAAHAEIQAANYQAQLQAAKTKAEHDEVALKQNKESPADALVATNGMKMQSQMQSQMQEVLVSVPSTPAVAPQPAAQAVPVPNTHPVAQKAVPEKLVASEEAKPQQAEHEAEKEAVDRMDQDSEKHISTHQVDAVTKPSVHKTEDKSSPTKTSKPAV